MQEKRICPSDGAAVLLLKDRTVWAIVVPRCPDNVGRAAETTQLLSKNTIEEHTNGLGLRPRPLKRVCLGVTYEEMYGRWHNWRRGKVRLLELNGWILLPIELAGDGPFMSTVLACEHIGDISVCKTADGATASGI